MVGASVGFYTGDIKRLPEDMKALRPTVIPAVPRLLNRMYDKVSDDWIRDPILFRILFSFEKLQIIILFARLKFSSVNHIRNNHE